MQIAKSVLKKVYLKRKPWSKKGDFGKVIVIGGSKFYSGSPAFNALAAYRAGADLVTIAGPSCIADPVRTYAPDIIFSPCELNFLSMNCIDTLIDIVQSNDALVIGCGLTRGDELREIVREIIKHTDKPCVIDADAIHAIAERKTKLHENCILTPHAKEFFVLTGQNVTDSSASRTKLVKNSAKKYNCTVLLKGHCDVISDGHHVAINITGSPYMTKGGLGDTLAGICGALMARKWVDSFTAACAGAYINGAAGALAAKKYGEGTMASDLIREITNVIK